MKIILSFILCISTCLAGESLKIEARGNTTGHGQCVAIKKDTVITAAHILKGEDGKYRTAYINYSGTWYKGTTIKISEKYDLAVIQLEFTSLKAYNILEIPKVILSGASRDKPVINREVTIENFYSFFEDSHEGISGSALFVDDYIIGIVTSRTLDESKVFVISSEEIKKFLKD